MSIFDGVTSESLFSFNYNRQANMETISSQALTRGIDLYMKEDYHGAVNEFQRAIGLAPKASFASRAFEFKAEAHLKMDEPEKAKQTYRAAIQVLEDPEEFHIKLANLHFADQEYDEAEKGYAEAVNINPSANNYYSLGQLYLNTNRFSEAENMFQMVDRINPESPNGHFGLGQTYGRKGNYEAAIEQFKEAIDLKDDFIDAKAEMGYVYADMGKMDEAQKIVDDLEKDAPGLSDLLSRYMYKADKPKMLFAWASSSFSFSLGRKTSVSVLDEYLANQGATKSFTMEIRFDKEMDRNSIENPANWEIARASGKGPGQDYNFGLPTPDTEVRISPIPTSVYYDADLMTAVVRFSISQNEEGTGTIDPSHISFKFKGKDIHGNSMNSDYDEYTGFSGVA